VGRTSDSEHAAALFEHGADGVLVASPQGHLLGANPAALRLLGCSGPELQRLGWPGLAVDQPGVLALLQHGRPGDTRRGEADLRRADGSTVAVELTAVTVPGGAGPRTYVTVRDVSSSRAVVEALRASEERFRQLAENAREVFWLLEVPGGRISYVNRAYEEMWGRTCQSLYDAPEDWYEALHPEDRPRVVAAYESSPDHAYDEEYRILHADGTVRWIRDRAVPVRGADGQVRRVAGIAEDITARKQSEEQLRSTNRALLTLSRCNEALVRATSEQALYDEVCRVIVEEAGYRLCWVGLVEQDERKTIRPVAMAGQEQGYLASLDVVWSDTERGRGPTGTAARTARPVVGRDFLTDPELAPWRAEALRRGFRSSAALPLVGESGSLGVLSMYAGEAAAFGDAELHFLEQLAEDLAFGVAAHRARADRDRLNGQLARADRLVAMGTLSAGVAHEINNPLTYVVSAVEHLEGLLRASPAGLPAAATEAALGVLAEAREGAERVRLIVRDLRTLSRVDDIRVERVELLPVLDFAVGISRNELKHRARLVKAYGPLPAVMGNAAKLGQVFLNLLINAAQAIPPGRVDRNEVRLSTSTDAGGRAVIEVRDTGTGVPPEVAARIFEPFVTTKRLGEGTGLGLSICRAVITSLGGEISFEDAPDRGAIFRVVLPAAGAPQAAMVAPTVPAAAAAGRRGRVAVVDDELGVRRAIVRILASEHDVEEFDGARGLAEQIAAGQRFDAILCDLMMPEMTGMELHGLLLRSAPAQAAAMIFMTGGTFTEEGQGFLDAVPNARLEKPFEVLPLRELIRGRVGAG
jgi:PAS domain S-box-containing protein